jgi:hypothetical protein
MVQAIAVSHPPPSAFAEILDEIQDRLPKAAGSLRVHCGDMSEFIDVRPRDKGLLARPGKNRAVYLGIIPGLFKSRSQVFPSSAIQSVETLWTIDSDVGNGALLFIQNVFECLSY